MPVLFSVKEFEEMYDDSFLEREKSSGVCLMNDIGTRDYKHKPPRHYFYESIKSVVKQKGYSDILIEYILDLMTELREHKFSFAKTIIKDWIWPFLSDQYPGNYLAEISNVVKLGADKYGHENYKKGMLFSLCISSFMGHLEHYDENPQEPNKEIVNKLDYYNDHRLHMGANMLILLHYLETFDEEKLERFNDIPNMYEAVK